MDLKKELCSFNTHASLMLIPHALIGRCIFHGCLFFAIFDCVLVTYLVLLRRIRCLLSDMYLSNTQNLLQFLCRFFDHRFLCFVIMHTCSQRSYFDSICEPFMIGISFHLNFSFSALHDPLWAFMDISSMVESIFASSFTIIFIMTWTYLCNWPYMFSELGGLFGRDVFPSILRVSLIFYS